jgi:hypothetical protein
MRRRLAAGGQDLPEDLPMLGLGAAAVLGGPDAERSDDVIVEVTNGQRGHGALRAADAVNACI